MKTIIAAVVMAAAGAAVAPAGFAYEVDEVGSFHIGGAQVTLSGLPEREIVFTPGAPPLKVNPNGDFEAGQMYVQYVKLESPKARYPLLLWHGGGLTGVTWETKPDGSPGWQQFFLRNGHDVYVSDAVERGTPRSTRPSRSSAPRRKAGNCSGSAPPTIPILRSGWPSTAPSSPRRPTTSSPSRACRAGPAMMPPPRKPTMRWYRRCAPA